MSYVLLGIAIVAAFFALMYLLLGLRAVLFGGGFETLGTVFVYALVIAVGAIVALWLGPLALAGIGLL